MHEHIIQTLYPNGAKPFPVSDPNGFKQFVYKGSTLSPKQMGYDVMAVSYTHLTLPTNREV